LLRAIADDETSGILAPHASTGMSAESMKMIVVRRLLLDAGGTVKLGESRLGKRRVARIGRECREGPLAFSQDP